MSGPPLWGAALDGAAVQRSSIEQTNVLQAQISLTLDPITALTQGQQQTLSELRRRLESAFDALHKACAEHSEKPLGDTNTEDAAAAVRRVVGLCDSLHADVSCVTGDFKSKPSAFALPVVTAGLVRLGSVLHSARALAAEEKRELELLAKEVPAFEALYRRLEEAVARGQDVCHQAPLPEPVLLPALGSPTMRSAGNVPQLSALEQANAELLELRARHQFEVQKLREELEKMTHHSHAPHKPHQLNHRDKSHHQLGHPSAEVKKLRQENVELVAQVRKADSASRAVTARSPLPARLAEQLQRVRSKLTDAEHLMTSMETLPKQSVQLESANFVEPAAMQMPGEAPLAEAFARLQKQLAKCRPLLSKTSSRGAGLTLTGSVVQVFEHVERLVSMGVEVTHPLAGMGMHAKKRQIEGHSLRQHDDHSSDQIAQLHHHRSELVGAQLRTHQGSHRSRTHDGSHHSDQPHHHSHQHSTDHLVQSHHHHVTADRPSHHHHVTDHDAKSHHLPTSDGNAQSRNVVYAH